MKRLYVYRLAFGMLGTFGYLRVLDPLKEVLFECCVLEPPVFPWVRENQPAVAAIPCGDYPMVRGIFHRNTPRRDDDYPCLLVNDVPDRAFIKVHAGNTIHDTRGCPLVGDRFGMLRGCPAVLNSRATLALLVDKFDEEEPFRGIFRELREELTL